MGYSFITIIGVIVLVNVCAVIHKQCAAFKRKRELKKLRLQKLKEALLLKVD